MQKYRFEEGEEVAHKENLTHKIIIARILKESTTFPTGEIDNDGIAIRKRGTRMIGIECHWWEGNKLIKEKFHSKELIPWLIAQKGKEEVVKWLTKQFNKEQ